VVKKYRNNPSNIKINPIFIDIYWKVEIKKFKTKNIPTIKIKILNNLIARKFLLFSDIKFFCVVF